MITPGTEIDATRAKYSTCHRAIRKAGLVVVPKESNPPLVWVDGILSILEAENLLPYQRVNKIPCLDFLCYKSTLFEELNLMRKDFPSYFEFYPHTYLLPDSFPEFQREHSFICSRTATAPVWVIKPRSGCCGKGIHFIQSIQEAETINYPSVAQLLVNPLTIDGMKFDFRFFLLIASLDPFSAFIYEEGIARFCTEKYIPPSKSNLDHPYAQLTNTAINKHSGQNPESFTQPASTVIQKIIAQKPSTANLWDEIKTVSLLTLAGIFPSIVATLPMNGGNAIRSKLIDVNNCPQITVPSAPPVWLNPQKNFPFLGAQRHSKKGYRKKKNAKLSKVTKKGKGKKQQEDQKPSGNLIKPMEPEEMNRSTEKEDPSESEQSESSPSSTPTASNRSPNPKERVLNDAQHYSHIIGIDIIIDSKGHPKVLELNDRPSLMVTAHFEQELKENMLAESYTHISLDGGFFGNNEKSRWQQLYPLSPKSELAAPVRAMLMHNSNLKYTGRIGVNSPGIQRMVGAGIKPEIHSIKRNKFIIQPPSNAQPSTVTLNLPPMRDEIDDAM